MNQPKTQPIKPSAGALLSACRRFVDYYSGNKQAQLGNGQAYKSCDEIRAALPSATDRETGVAELLEAAKGLVEIEISQKLKVECDNNTALEYLARHYRLQQAIAKCERGE